VAFPLPSECTVFQHEATLTSAQDVENEVLSFFSVIFNGAISKLEGSGVPFFPSPAHFPTFPKKRETP
jgi:hypothetical protein